MNNIKSHFRYNKSQRNGVFFLLLIIVLLLITFFFFDFSSNTATDFSQNEIESFKKEQDSLLKIKLENSKPKIYPFNPNYITDFKGYQLGMSTEEIDRLLSFRKTGKFVNSIEEFKNVTKIRDSILNKISPYFKFPDWVTTKNNKPNNNFKQPIKQQIEEKDLNLVTAEDLIKIRGIGEKTATRILNYREKLQGFTYSDQLYEVYYLDKEVADKALEYYKILSKPTIKKININTALFKEVLAIVYVDYELTKKIFNYRDEVAEIQSLEELKKIDGFPLEKFDRISLYLVAE
ncbi:helix-hairpin-helix domain-containing protein [Lutibacter sp. A80]|uniref:ComEA family DNA-binding protein n=1 Tax=Lutibacter sp. A80 TaxID=2918453 RepID=UPI001F06FA07|nr:helix-hairpin-helix domain-containing protein [Lutibacter sp. A80]UMB60516.1 helix-hairpin-helix domain-containing protein [Lutibacter sp. A80]